MALDVVVHVGGVPLPAGRVVELEVSQSVEDEMDSLYAVLDAAGSAVPPSGRSVEAWAGGAYLGGYAVADLSLELPEDRFRVFASGADLQASGLRTPATRAWADGLTLAALAEQIAGDHGYQARIHPDFRGAVLAHVDQVRESDLQFLSRAADEADADLRFVGGHLLLLPRTGTATVGSTLPLAVTLTEWIRLRARFRDRSDWRAWEARYYDYDQGRPVTVRLGAPGVDAYQVAGVQGDAAAAARAAQRARTRLTERSASLTVTAPGNPALIPHVKLGVGSIREGVPETWRVISCTHRVDRKEGYTTIVRAVLDAPPEARPAPPKDSKLSYSRVRYQDPAAAYRRLVGDQSE